MTGTADIAGANPDVDALVESMERAFKRLPGALMYVHEEWDALREGLAALARDAAEAKAALQHFKECADTPLMRDVLAERDRLARRVEELESAVGDLVAWADSDHHGTGAEALVSLSLRLRRARAVLAASAGPEEDA